MEVMHFLRILVRLEELKNGIKTLILIIKYLNEKDKLFKSVDSLPSIVLSSEELSLITFRFLDVLL